MSTRGQSRREFLVSSVSGLSAAWVAANYAGIVEAARVRPAGGRSGQPPSLRLLHAGAGRRGRSDGGADHSRPTPRRRARGARRQLHRPRADHLRTRAGRPTTSKGSQDLQAQTKQLVPGAAAFSALTSDAADPGAHRDGKDAVLQPGPHAHRHRVLRQPDARRQLQQGRVEAGQLRRLAAITSRRSATTTPFPKPAD